MKIFEFILAFGIVLIMFKMAHIRDNHALELGFSTLASHLRTLQIVALSDDYHFTHTRAASDMSEISSAIDTASLVNQNNNAMWQMQFHFGKIYTSQSYSIYIDTPRFATTTDFDSRPMAGDIILKNMDRKCLSAYNNTNTAVECKNNAVAEVRLGERFGIEEIIIESNSFCAERESARIYFDWLGMPYCGKIPQKINVPFKITLAKNNAKKSLCVMPYSGEIVLNC